MPLVEIKRMNDVELRGSAMFEQIEGRIEDIRHRAFELFEMRGCEPGHTLEDWLKAERELLGWPPLETQESEGEFEFQLPLDDFDVSQVSVMVAPSEIIVHAKTGSELQAVDDQTKAGARDVYRRIELPKRIKVDKTAATFDKGTIRIRAKKAVAPAGIAAVA